MTDKVPRKSLEYVVQFAKIGGTPVYEQRPISLKQHEITVINGRLAEERRKGSASLL